MSVNSSHILAVKMVGRAKRVLELGPGFGLVTRELVANDCHVTVIEGNADCEDALRAVAHEVFIGDLNSPAALNGLNGTFDVILAGDVLEHLISPSAVVRRLLPYLAEGGRFVISLPNVAHIDVRLHLLQGHFQYQPLGLLDATHLRHFTLESIHELLNEVGLKIVELHRTMVPALKTGVKVEPSLQDAKLVSRLLLQPEALTFQFVFSADLMGDPQNATLNSDGLPTMRQSRRLAAVVILKSCLYVFRMVLDAVQGYCLEKWVSLVRLPAAVPRDALTRLGKAFARRAGLKSRVDAPLGAGGWRRLSSALRPRLLEGVQAGGFKTQYRGVAFLKSPFDIAIYMQLIGRLKPATIIEVGSYQGGGALWFADMMQVHGIAANVVSLDIDPPELSDPRIQFIRADARSLGEVLNHDEICSYPRPLLIVEDSAHDHETCSAVLEFFYPHLTSGDYVVVEDGIVAFMGDSYKNLRSGPNIAVREFLARYPGSIEIDTSLCDFYGHNVTYNPNGWLVCK